MVVVGKSNPLMVSKGNRRLRHLPGHLEEIRQFSDARTHFGPADHSRWTYKEKIAKEAVKRESSHEPVSRQRATAILKPTLALKQFQSAQTSPF